MCLSALACAVVWRRIHHDVSTDTEATEMKQQPALIHKVQKGDFF